MYMLYMYATCMVAAPAGSAALVLAQQAESALRHCGLAAVLIHRVPRGALVPTLGGPPRGALGRGPGHQHVVGHHGVGGACGRGLCKRQKSVHGAGGGRRGGY